MQLFKQLSFAQTAVNTFNSLTGTRAKLNYSKNCVCHDYFKFTLVVRKVIFYKVFNLKNWKKIWSYRSTRISNKKKPHDLLLYGYIGTAMQNRKKRRLFQWNINHFLCLLNFFYPISYHQIHIKMLHCHSFHAYLPCHHKNNFSLTVSLESYINNGYAEGELSFCYKVRQAIQCLFCNGVRILQGSQGFLIVIWKLFSHLGSFIKDVISFFWFLTLFPLCHHFY